ncbi:MAG TPA: hypothetical protein PLR99_29420, partial [Polyangiaceae bacterium]|nr:hypothetical protein [Polyangiaceae bacterium]
MRTALAVVVSCVVACQTVQGAPEFGPPTRDPGTLTVWVGPIDRLDLLLVIDNSRSMGDKQALLSEAVPDLIHSLVTPNCVDGDGKPTGDRADPAAEEGKECARGKAEFKPVVDLHVGVVSSAMGGFGSDACAPDVQNPTNITLSAHNDDRGQLINRAGAKELAIGNASPSNFLSWFPGVK